MMDQIEKEVKKLIDVGFIREEQHPDCVTNIVSAERRMVRLESAET